MHAANSLTRLAALAAFFAPCLGAAADTLAPNDARRDVDVVIALDVSGSMEGLIESAKQRLWDITNELARARPVPALRVAILTYGNPTYGEQAGYVRVDLPFTADLDAVNATLFAFRTDGGEEYVARAIQTSLDSLQWSPESDALRDRVRRRQRIRGAGSAADDRGSDGGGVAPRRRRQRDLLRRRQRRRCARLAKGCDEHNGRYARSTRTRPPSRTSRRRSTRSSRR